MIANLILLDPAKLVLIEDIYDLRCPGIEYEIGFTLYGGSIDKPVKVVIESDGIRSHGHKHAKKDRKKRCQSLGCRLDHDEI